MARRIHHMGMIVTKEDHVRIPRDADQRSELMSITIPK